MNEAKPLLGRTAWVAGGFSGIGAATVKQLQAMGANVAILDIQEPSSDVPFAKCDLSDPTQIADAAEALTELVGAPDIFVACAAIPSQGDRITDLPANYWDQTLAVNLSSIFHLLKLVLPHMCEQGWGRIVTVSSSTAVRVYPGSAAYAATKAGLIALTKVAATEGAPHGVTANVVAPGYTDTPMNRKPGCTTEDLLNTARASVVANPMGVLLDPDDPAEAIAWFCHPHAHRITGQTLHVNAGSYMP